MRSGEIILLTGDMQSGKTNLCLEIAQIVLETGLDVAGIVSPAVFEGDKKIAIDAKNLRTGKCRRMAELQGEKKTGLETRRWSFDPEVVSWGNQVLRDAIPCDLLIVDELGPLEFNHQKGWVAGFPTIESRNYLVAIAVIRPSLLDTANQRWDISREIDLNSPAGQSMAGENILTILGFDPQRMG